MTRKTYIFNTLEDLQAHKDELQAKITQSNEAIGKLWGELFVMKKASTRGEMITSIVSKSITAFDAFMLVRKLVKQYGHIFGNKKK